MAVPGIRVFWRNNEIGDLTILEVDMWYSYCKWDANESIEAIQFKEMVANFNTAEIMKDYSKGTRITLQYPGSNETTNALVISLENDALLIRNVYDAVAVKWLVENVY